MRRLNGACDLRGLGCRQDGSVACWGHQRAANCERGGAPGVVRATCGNCTSVARHLQGGVVQVVVNSYACAALKATGEVVTWGYQYDGGQGRVLETQGRRMLSVASSCAPGTATSVLNGVSAETDASQFYARPFCFFVATLEDGTLLTWPKPPKSLKYFSEDSAAGLNYAMPPGGALTCARPG